MRPLSLSIQEHVLDWRPLPWPVRWPEVFGREAPLVLEIGFGNGQFLVEQALEHPERDHVGIELSWSAATRLLRRLEQAGTGNVRVLLVDAEAALVNLFAPESLAEVFVNHPCPWPKARHEERRLLSPAGLALVADRMRTGARLTIVTDHAEYAAWLREILLAQEPLRSCHATAEVSAIPGRRPTKYERKAMAQGVPIHYFQWEKRAPARAPAPPSETPDAMPSLILRGPHDARRLFAGFEPQVFQEEHDGVPVVVRLGAVYRRVDEDAWLVETLLLEDRLRQEFGILVVGRGPEELLVKLSSLGRPHPTHGVKRAVWCVGRWLSSRHPHLVLAHENLGAAATRAPGG